MAVSEGRDVKRIVVLGCGRVGATIALDLAADTDLAVTVVDRNADSLRRMSGQNLKTRVADLADPDAIRAVVEEADVAVGALPSALGFNALRTVLECAKPYCDISFMIEDGRELDDLARQRGVTAIIDCGVAPGLANLLIGHCHAQLDHTRDVAFYVGGLPWIRRWPYDYQAPFAPSDVIEEYTRPVRMIENGALVTRPALSGSELIEIPRVGTLEACNTDGLRTLLDTIKADNMREKTLRYPGHFELMRVLRETGFFGKDEIEVGGRLVRPLDLTSALLFPMWRRNEGEAEFTALRVIVEGEIEGRKQRQIYDLFDEYDPATGNTSMARTTGFPAAIVARFLANGRLAEPGVYPPERLVEFPGVFEDILSQLQQRGVTVTGRTEVIADAGSGSD